MSENSPGNQLPDAVMFRRGEQSEEEWRSKLAELGRVARELEIEQIFSYPEQDPGTLINLDIFEMAARELGRDPRQGTGARAYNLYVRSRLKEDPEYLRLSNFIAFVRAVEESTVDLPVGAARVILNVWRKVIELSDPAQLDSETQSE